MSVKWGLLSTALINELIIRAAAESPEIEIVAVASRDEARARAYAYRHGLERAYGSYEALLADADLDAVYIPLPNLLHVEWAVRALDAGKHVLVEKPLSRHPDQVEQAYDRADAAGLVLSEGFMWRHHPQTARLLELIVSGAIGELRLIRAAFGFDLAVERGLADTRFDPTLEGGALMDVGSYCVNALRLFGGEPVRARGEQVVGSSGVDVVFAGALAFEDGIVGVFDCGFVYPRGARLELVGETGSLFVPQPFTIRQPGIELRRPDGEPEQFSVEHANSYRLELENVGAAIRGEAPLLLGREDAVAQARTLEALYRSAEAD
jgi:xylose dehydrogenase (NAD/NADP)